MPASEQRSWRSASCHSRKSASRRRSGSLSSPAISTTVLRSGLRILGLAPDHGLQVADLPLHHRDPFDRLLISQARSEGLAIVTADHRFAAYDVAIIDAAS